MTKPINVSDLNSNYEENIERWARELSKSRRRLAVFTALYKGRKQSKTVSAIAKLANVPEQAVRDVGHELRGLGLCGHERSGEKGNRAFLYTKLPHISAIRDRIIRLAENPGRIAGLSTKRRPKITASVASFSKKAKAPRSTSRRNLRRKPADVRIVFLATNPDSDLRTDVEMRDVQAALRATTYRDNVDLRHIPAARLGDLLSALNELKPTVVHFSGHGGGEAIVFEADSGRSGGAVIDYALVAEFIEATDTPPKVLVLNACDTYDGADAFLASVEVVVAMLDSIDDAAAGYFSTQFYSALANGQSIESAVRQGKAVLRAGGFPDAELPKAFAREGISLSSYKLVG